VATLTLVNGTDNLAVCTPVFATTEAEPIAVTLAAFAAGRRLVRSRRGADPSPTASPPTPLVRYGRLILPAAGFLIALCTLHTTNDPFAPEP
jgi:cadmium resistance protein CadD (predicted permease)